MVPGNILVLPMCLVVPTMTGKMKEHFPFGEKSGNFEDVGINLNKILESQESTHNLKNL